MTGEAWGHGVMKSDYYQNGFDAMINFDFQDQASQALGCFADIDATYRQMAERLQDFNVLSYLSSHDTRLFFAGDAKARCRCNSGRRTCCCWRRVRCRFTTAMKAAARSAQPVPIRCRAPAPT